MSLGPELHQLQRVPPMAYQMRQRQGTEELGAAARLDNTASFIGENFAYRREADGCDERTKGHRHRRMTRVCCVSLPCVELLGTVASLSFETPLLLFFCRTLLGLPSGRIAETSGSGGYDTAVHCQAQERTTH